MEYLGRLGDFHIPRILMNINLKERHRMSNSAMARPDLTFIDRFYTL
jgi:hypothetical protein